jgi:hypothetical protein
LSFVAVILIEFRRAHGAAGARPKKRRRLSGEVEVGVARAEGRRPDADREVTERGRRDISSKTAYHRGLNSEDRPYRSATTSIQAGESAARAS